MLRTVRNKTHDTEALVRACRRVSGKRGVKTHRYAVLKDVGNGRLLDRTTPVQITPEVPDRYPCFIPALQDFGRIPRKNSAVMTVMTSTPRSQSH